MSFAVFGLSLVCVRFYYVSDVLSLVCVRFYYVSDVLFDFLFVFVCRRC